MIKEKNGEWKENCCACPILHEITSHKQLTLHGKSSETKYGGFPSRLITWVTSD